MKGVLEAGTDTVSLSRFDPATLPNDFDVRFRKRHFSVFECLITERKLLKMDTGANGAYLLHAYEDEAVPDYLTRHLREPWAGSAEYRVFRHRRFSFSQSQVVLSPRSAPSVEPAMGRRA